MDAVSRCLLGAGNAMRLEADGQLDVRLDGVAVGIVGKGAAAEGPNVGEPDLGPHRGLGGVEPLQVPTRSAIERTAIKVGRSPTG